MPNNSISLLKSLFMDVPTPEFYQSQSIISSSSHGVSTEIGGATMCEIENPVSKLISNKAASDCYRLMPIQTTTTSSSSSSGNSGSNSGSSMETRAADMLNFSSQRKKLEAPSTPGRPVFSFSISKKGFPSKWDDAQKWLSNSCHESPAHPMKPSSSSSFEVSRVSSVQGDGFRQQLQLDEFDEQCRVSCNQKVLSFTGSVPFELIQQQQLKKKKLYPTRKHGGGVSSSVEVFLKDKFTEEVEPVITQTKYSEPCTEGFMFKNNSVSKQLQETSKLVLEVQHRDIGTEMTPLGSLTTSRCPTPYKSPSPARHNTPADRSGPLPMSGSSSGNSSSIDISQLQKCHLAKLQLGTQYDDAMVSTWSSRQEEEEDVSKSLRHFDSGFRKSYSEARTIALEEEENTKCCLRYQREEAKIQAWINLQNAKAEAQSRKLEVKIERMRSNLEEKLMKRMEAVHRKAEEWRAGARLQHSAQIKKSSDLARKFLNKHPHFPTRKVSCGCLPCNNIDLSL